ncbi:MAG: type II toxin-antitoxin system prevent-host-death family antitoxin [Methylocystis sp.]
MSYPTSDLSRKAGTIMDEAMRRPVTLTRYNKPRFVLLNVEDYERLTGQHDPRRSFTVEDMPDDLRGELLEGVAEVLDEIKRP